MTSTYAFDDNTRWFLFETDRGPHLVCVGGEETRGPVADLITAAHRCYQETGRRPIRAQTTDRTRAKVYEEAANETWRVGSGAVAESPHLIIQTSAGPVELP